MRLLLNIPHYYCRTDTFKISFFPNVINEWNKVDDEIKGATSFSMFKASLLKLGRPHANSTYRIHNPVGIRFLTRLHLGLSHLNEHKFRHNFADCVNPLCSCSIKPETILHFFLHCHIFLNIRRKLFYKTKLLDRPVSLLPIFGKFFERLIFNSLFKCIDENEMVNPNQSGFRPFDSCVNQLLSINHEIFSNFDCDPPKDIRAVFLDISKAFDNIWLPGLIFKIKSFGIQVIC